MPPAPTRALLPPRATRDPTLILLVTDDQTADTMTGTPAGMPWLGASSPDPGSGWRWYPQHVRLDADVLPLAGDAADRAHRAGHGRHRQRGRRWRLDEGSRSASWLHDAGYRTAMIGKYLNGYPWDRGPYVPPGWDRWLAKTNDADATPSTTGTR